MMNWKSIVFGILTFAAGGATAMAHADDAHAPLWHALTAISIAANGYFGLTSPDLSAKPPTPSPQPEPRL